MTYRSIKRGVTKNGRHSSWPYVGYKRRYGFGLHCMALFFWTVYGISGILGLYILSPDGRHRWDLSFPRTWQEVRVVVIVAD